MPPWNRKSSWTKSAFTWIHSAVDWLFEHRPSEQARLAICHGDFHPFNIVYADGKITGILDGGGIADPAYDVGNTLVLLAIPFRHLAASMGFSSIDFDLMADLYLRAYRTHRDSEVITLTITESEGAYAH